MVKTTQFLPFSVGFAFGWGVFDIFLGDVLFFQTITSLDKMQSRAVLLIK